MSPMDTALDQAIEFLTSPSVTPPTSSAVVEALLQAETTAKRTKVSHGYSQLIGTWRLGFITGTKRSRQRAGVILGSGRFLPKWIKIHLSYSPSESSQDQGTVQNAVQFGPIQIVLTGPTKFYPKTNILAFDFSQIRISLSGLTLYQGYIKGGQDRETRFYEQPLKEQAFFTYFLVENRCIAARGRGGGLAIWSK
nr:hypothetical protein [Moorena bouillonii]